MGKELMTEQKIEELVTRIRVALLEKLAASRALKEAYNRDVLANTNVRDAKEELRLVEFPEMRE